MMLKKRFCENGKHLYFRNRRGEVECALCNTKLVRREVCELVQRNEILVTV